MTTRVYYRILDRIAPGDDSEEDPRFTLERFEAALAMLSPTQRQMLELRWGLNGGTGLVQSDVARAMKRSSYGISAELANAEKKLRRLLASGNPIPTPEEQAATLAARDEETKLWVKEKEENDRKAALDPLEGWLSRIVSWRDGSIMARVEEIINDRLGRDQETRATVGDLVALSPSELFSGYGMGEKRLRRVQEILSRHGLSLRKEDAP